MLSTALSTNDYKAIIWLVLQKMITSTLCDDTMTSMPIQESSNPNEREILYIQ